jgi:hypothetical protein
VQVAAVDRATGVLCGDCAVRVATEQPRTAEVGVHTDRFLEGAAISVAANSSAGNLATNCFAWPWWNCVATCDNQIFSAKTATTARTSTTGRT